MESAVWVTLLCCRTNVANVVFTGLLMNVIDLEERKLEKTNEQLIPLYCEIAVIKLELIEKLEELQAIERRLLGETEAKLRQSMRDDV